MSKRPVFNWLYHMCSYHISIDIKHRYIYHEIMISTTIQDNNKLICQREICRQEKRKAV